MPIGLNQINNPTPAWVYKAFNVIFYAAAILNLAILSFTGIPEHIQLAILKYSGAVVVFARGLAHLFGVEIKEPSISKEDVAALKHPV